MSSRDLDSTLPPAYRDLIRFDASEFEVAQAARGPQLGRSLLAVVMAVVMGAFGYGVFAGGLSAADDSAFNAGAQTLSAGCQANDVQTKLVTSRIPGRSGYWATGIEVSQVDSAACQGSVIDVIGLNNSDTSIGEGSHVVVAGTNSYTIDFTAPADANQIKGIAITIAA